MITGLLLVLLAGLAVGLVRANRRRVRLQRQLEAAIGELQHLQEACTRLAPAGVVQRLAADGATSATPITPERKVATALFVDLVGYTALSEQLEPAVLAQLLNGYFQRMSDAVHEHGGHVSTFLGDGLLAYFGALTPNPWQCNDAVHAALAMRASIREYNIELETAGLAPLAIGIGIHRGPGLVGMIGSRERMEFGFVGPTVNLAARVQGLTRTCEFDILITEALRSELDPRIELVAMPAAKVKGIEEAVVTYAVLGE